ncbi:uncharacterized protein LOC143211554 [Lasioglossum baleicum]|uniref:uncharacterized protein LOC143211554 n=1 Tax=Lasioglossum baleicum TaxID=434251 RepID=UPI003FCCED95
MVKLLIQYGADLNVKDSRRRSPIDIAKESWNPEFKELLLINGAVVRKDNALHAAVNSGNLEIVEELLKDGVDVSIIEDSDLIIGKTVLHRAVCTRQLEITKLLITYGADVNLKDCWGKTPLAEALQIKHTEMVELVLTNGADIKEVPNILYAAVEYGSLVIVEEILKDGVDINMIDSTNYGQGKTLLHSAVRERHVEMAKLLIKYGANVNVKASSRTTPLADALRINNTEMVELLLTNGADIKEDRNVLYAAVMNGYVNIVEDLLKDGVDVNTIDNSNDEGMMVLHSAVCMRQEKITELLIKYGAKVSVKDSSRKTPLVHALRMKETKIVEQLLINGADIKDDTNVLYAAVEYESLEIVEKILKDGVDDNKIDSKNYVEYGMLLHDVVSWKNVEMAKLFMKYGANVNVRDRFGATPLVTAIYKWDTEMTKLLLINGADINEDSILHSAVMIGSVNIEELLNECRDDISYNTNLLNGMTLLHSTVAWSQVGRAKLLIEHGANVNAKDDYGRTPLNDAILKQDIEMVILFLSDGADLNEDLKVLYKNHHDHEIPVIDLLKKHIAMEKAEDLYVSEKNLLWISNDYENVGYLHQLGGHSMREAVRACFDDALSDSVALSHTWTGIRGTRPLYKTRIVKAIYEATFRSAAYPKATKADFADAGKAALKAAKQRAARPSAREPSADALAVADARACWTGRDDDDDKDDDDDHCNGNGDVINYVFDDNDDGAVFEYLRAEHGDGTDLEYLEPEYNDTMRLQQLEKKVDQQRNNWENRGTVVTLRTWSDIRGTRPLYYMRIMRAIHETTIRSTWYAKPTTTDFAAAGKATLEAAKQRARGHFNRQANPPPTPSPSPMPADVGQAVPSSTINLTEVDYLTTHGCSSYPEGTRRSGQEAQNQENMGHGPDSTRNLNQKICFWRNEISMAQVCLCMYSESLISIEKRDTEMTKRIEEDPQVLCTAVKNGDLKIVEDLLKDGADVNTIDGTYQIECVTLLHSALHREQVEMVKLLIQYGADLNVKDSRRRSPIDIAKESWNPEFKELLLINGAVVRKDNALHAAVNSGNLEIVEELLKDGVDVNIIEDSDLIIGKTVLHRAVCTRQLELTKLLITYGADVNLKDCWGKTPLAEAFQIKHTEMVELLLTNGADIKEDPNILYAAGEYGSLVIVEEILKDGVDINMIDSTNYGQGKTLLHSAVRERHVEMAKLLIKYGANVNVKASSRTTPLADALRINNTEMVELLLTNGADIKEDRNILYAAVMNGYVNIVEDLLKDGVDVNTIDNSNDEGMTVLHSAVCMRQEKITELLIKYGAKVSVKDSSGKTPLVHALRMKETKIVEQLLLNGADIKDDPNVLYAAVEYESLEIVEKILKDGVDDNKIDSKNYVEYGTLLHDVVSWKNVEMAKLFIKYGAHVNVRDRFGATPLVTAIYNWDTEMTKLLLINGADINEDSILHSAVMIGSVNIEELLNECRDDISDNTNLLNGMTLLHSTVAWSQVERAKLLIEHGANVNAKDDYGRTPLDDAILKQDIEMVILFLSNGADLNEDLKVLYKNHHDHEIPVIDLLKKHIAMEKAADLYVSEKNLLWISNDYKINYFLNKCEAEIDIMKSEKIGNSFASFYDILKKNTSKLAKNESIVQAMKLNDYKKKFPIYASMIDNRFRRGVQRNELLERVRNKFLPSLSESLNELPLLCTGKIFTYLNDFDLRFLLLVCELFNKYICI